MTLAWKTVERSLRRRVRAELRSSKELWREFKRNRRSRPRQMQIEPILRFLVPLMLAGFAVAGPHAPGLVLVSLTFYATGTAFLRAAALLRGLHASPDLNVLAHFPVADEDLLRLQWKRFHRSSLWLLHASAAIYLALSIGKGGAALGVAAGLALLQWLGVLGLSSALAAWRPAWPLDFVGKTVCALAVVPIVFGKTLGPLVEEATGAALLAVPSGWTTFAFRNGLLLGQAWAYAAALPAAALAILFPLAGRRLLRTYAVGEIVYPSPPTAEVLLEDLVARRTETDPVALDRPDLKPAVREELRRSIPEFMEQRVLEGAYLRKPAWTRSGPLERAFAAVLSPADLAVADLLLGGGMSWSSRWTASAAAAAAGSALVLLLGPGHTWAATVTAVLMTLPLLAGTWPGFQAASSGGAFIALHGIYPVGFWQASSILFRAALLRILAWTPLAAGFALVAGTRGHGPPDGLAFVLKVVAALIAFVPVSTLFRVSGGTNDTERLRFLRFVLVFVPVALLFLGAGVSGAALFSLRFPEGWPLFGLLVAPPYLAWLLYGALYNRGSVDLVRTTPAHSS